jgi:hypothetical protein
MADMTDKAIAWVRQQKALMPDKPFFAYFAPGATHAPHHVTPEWADKYKGAFDDGWDTLRERTFARQKELGVIPEDAELTARHDEIPAWDDMPEDLKPVLRRQMEIYAGFLEFPRCQKVFRKPGPLLRSISNCKGPWGSLLAYCGKEIKLTLASAPARLGRLGMSQARPPRNREFDRENRP